MPVHYITQGMWIEMHYFTIPTINSGTTLTVAFNLDKPGNLIGFSIATSSGTFGRGPITYTLTDVSDNEIPSLPAFFSQMHLRLRNFHSNQNQSNASASVILFLRK